MAEPAEPEADPLLPRFGLHVQPLERPGGRAAATLDIYIEDAELFTDPTSGYLGL